jgi:hypothetical protein
LSISLRKEDLLAFSVSFLIEKWLVNKSLPGCIIITNKSGRREPREILTLQLTPTVLCQYIYAFNPAAAAVRREKCCAAGYNNRYYVGEERHNESGEKSNPPLCVLCVCHNHRYSAEKGLRCHNYYRSNYLDYQVKRGPFDL